MIRVEKSKRYSYMKRYREEHPDYVLRCKERVKEYRKKNPWYGSFTEAKTRCTNENRVCFKRYGGRGILFVLTKEEAAHLWERDNANKMKRPTIDRINNEGNYEFDNCRFIEHSENAKKGNLESRWK